MADAKKTTKAAPKKATEVKTIDQLHEELVKLQGEHLESRKSHRAGELVNPHVLTVQRKNIARAHTAISIAKKTAVKEEN
jgi:ribosomal protein L29